MGEEGGKGRRVEGSISKGRRETGEATAALGLSGGTPQQASSALCTHPCTDACVRSKSRVLSVLSVRLCTTLFRTCTIHPRALGGALVGSTAPSFPFSPCLPPKTTARMYGSLSSRSILYSRRYTPPDIPLPHLLVACPRRPSLVRLVGGARSDGPVVLALEHRVQPRLNEGTERRMGGRVQVQEGGWRGGEGDSWGG